MHFSDKWRICGFCRVSRPTKSWVMTSSFLLFCLTCGILTVLTLASLLAPLWRHRQSGPSTPDLDIYRDQLAEVDRDLTRGVLDEAEAERTRTEISRRLLNADATARAEATHAPPALTRIAGIALGAVIVIGTGFTYFTLGAPGYGDLPRAERLEMGEARRDSRPRQAEAEALVQMPDRVSQFDAATQGLIQTRRATTFERPDDPQAWSVLSQTEAAIGNYHRATRAQEQLVRLQGNTPAQEDLTRLLDLMVVGTQGYVSPEAEDLALRLLQNDPSHIAALYYAGLMYQQNDRPDRAFSLWRRVIENTPADDPYRAMASGQINSVSSQLGITYEVPATTGPTSDQIAMAEEMAPEDRQTMIEGMVAGLAERLASDGGPPQDWARLISSLVVLGETDRATAIAAEAREVFADNADALTLIRTAMDRAGIAE